MRPSEIMALVAAVILAIGGVVVGIGVFFDNNGGEYWFYWIAPLLALGLGGMLVALAVGYYVKVVRLETKGRPRRD